MDCPVATPSRPVQPPPPVPAATARAPRLDALTGLPDRDGLIRRTRALQARRRVPAAALATAPALATALATAPAAATAAARAPETLTVLSLDIERFTDINEQFGLAAGDMLLRQVAARCLRVCREWPGDAAVGRVGPDEFALVLVSPVAPGAADQVEGSPAAGADTHRAAGHALQRALAEPFDLGGGHHGLRLEAAIGQAPLAPYGDPALALLHAAAARHHGRREDAASPGHAHPIDRVHHHADRHDALALTRALREALAADCIEIALQPKIALASGRLAGLEALARWRLPDGRDVAPGVFIPLAERHGLISALGERVLERSLATLADWRLRGLPLVPIAVNFSAPQFHCRDTAARVAQALERHALPAALLELELTESMLPTQADAVLQTLRSLRLLGVTLSLDDFGTGYSALTYLRRFPVHCLKLDAGFVSGMADDAGAAAIVRLIVDLAHRLGLRCVAEGVETRDQLAALRAMGCDEAQGYLLARPMSAVAVASWLDREPPWRGLFTEALADADPADGA